jgi:tight adherence protein B
MPLVGPIALLIGASLPILWLRRRRTVRIRKFEEQFPEALDMLSRAMRAGHAFQTALGTAGDEMPAPVGVELKQVFDRQNSACLSTTPSRSSRSASRSST